MNQPPPSRESLRALLARVHERLGEAGSVDADSLELLRQVMGDIERTLQADRVPHGVRTRSPVPAVGAAAEAHTSKLEALAVQFEADHPGLAEGLRSLADLLGKAGI
jgi:hypothetical protein